jgi:hypothetical protein
LLAGDRPGVAAWSLYHHFVFACKSADLTKRRK